MTELDQDTSATNVAAPSAHPADVTLQGGTTSFYSGPGDIQRLPASSSTTSDSQSPGAIIPPLVFNDDTYYQGFPPQFGNALVSLASPQPDYFPMALICKGSSVKGTIYLQQSSVSPEPADWPPDSPYRQTVLVAFNDGQKNVVVPIIDYCVRWNSWGAVKFISSGDAKNSHVLSPWPPGSSHWTAGPYDKLASFDFDAKPGQTIAIIGLAAGAWNDGGGGISTYGGEWSGGGNTLVDGTERSALYHTWVFVGGDTVLTAGSGTRSETFTVSHGTSKSMSFNLSLQLGLTVKEGVIFASSTQSARITEGYSWTYTVTNQTTVSQMYKMQADQRVDSRSGVYQLYDAYGVNMPRATSYFNYVQNNLPQNMHELKFKGKPCTLPSSPLGQLGFGFEQPIALLPSQSAGGDASSDTTALVRVWKYCSSSDNNQCKMP